VLGDQGADPAAAGAAAAGARAADLALLQLERQLRADFSQAATGATAHPPVIAPLHTALAAARNSVDQLAALPPAERTPSGWARVNRCSRWCRWRWTR
jgi:hypothetical protein